ncbi:hypothetical protein D3C87_1547890 [compost metagenome]
MIHNQAQLGHSIGSTRTDNLPLRPAVFTTVTSVETTLTGYSHMCVIDNRLRFRVDILQQLHAPLIVLKYDNTGGLI